MGFNDFIKKEYVVCPFCGYNNEKERFTYFGTCLRCNKIIDKKLYLKRRIYESQRKELKYRERKRFDIYIDNN